MKMVKSLLLGSAAGLVAVAGAQAADLPVKAKPVEYVKICSLYGVGYYYIPGTQTCLKIGGFVRAEVNFNAGGSHVTNMNGAMSQFTRGGDTHTWRSRGGVNFDTRSQTEYGTLRTYFSIWGTFSNGVDAFSTDRAFIQFAGFTAGKLTSAVTAPWAGLPGTSAGRFFGADDFGSGVNGLHYTADFGNGVTATIGLEEAVYRRQKIWNLTTGQLNAPSGTTIAVNGAGGFRFPDLVGNIQVNQAWGTAFLGAQASQQFPLYYGATETTGSPGSEWGWAITGGLNLKLPQLGAGDQMWVEATYTNGILGRLTGSSNPTSIGVFGNSSIAYQSVTPGFLLDAVYTTGSTLELTTGWGMAAGIEHFWVPSRLRSSLFGSYASIDYGATANTWMCTNYAGVATFSVGSTCDFDLSFWQVGTRTIWTPVAGLDFTAEVLYTNIDQNHAGTVTPVAATWGVKPGGVPYELKDAGVWSGLLRVQRTW